MTSPEQQRKQPADARDYLAAERTLLAWIRTGLALMGFGFVVARFGLLLQELRLTQHDPALSYGLSMWFGTALLAAGVIVNVSSAWRHVRVVRELDSGETRSARVSTLAVATAVFLAACGLAAAIYFVSIHFSIHDVSMGRANNSEVHTVPVTQNGIVDRPSGHSVDHTVERLEQLLQSKGITLFAVIDHSGEAAKVGMTMRPTKLLIFGSPKAGTPLMLAAPSIAIDLPLKVLVWEDGQGKVWVSYNDPGYLKERHGVPQDLLPNIAGVETLAAKAAE